jgi:hypothetical protein
MFAPNDFQFGLGQEERGGAPRTETPFSVEMSLICCVIA